MIDSALVAPYRAEAADDIPSARAAFRQGALAGATVFFIYWIVECWFCSVFPWLARPHYEYKAVHPALTTFTLVLYPFGGLLLAGLCGWGLRSLAVWGYGRVSLVPASGVIALVAFLNGCLLVTLPRSQRMGFSAAISTSLLFLIFRLFARSRSMYTHAVMSPWAVSVLLFGTEYLTNGFLSGKSVVVKIASLFVTLPAMFLPVLVAHLVAKHWAPRTRRALLAAATLAMLSAALAFQPSPIEHGMKAPLPAQASSRPNVILISMDTVRADHLSVYGYAQNTSPHLRDLAALSTLYTRSVAAGDLTLSTHGSIFTGQYPSAHGAHCGPGQAGCAPLPQGSRTLAKILSEHGYVTAGVVANDAFLLHSYGLDQGFQYWDQRLGVRFLSTSEVSYVRLSIEELLNHLYTYPAYEKQARNGGEINRDVFPLLKPAGNDGRPFFLFVNYMDAHTPYTPPAPFDRLYPGKEPHFTMTRLNTIKADVMGKGLPIAFADRAHMLSQYDGGIAYLDSQIGNLVSRLKQLGLYENTLLIVTSDHGEAFGEKSLVGHGVGVYQSLVHVPLIIKFPHQNSQATVDDLVSSVDIMPTILDQLGYPIPAWVQGRSLLKPAPGSGRPVFSESFADPYVSRMYPKLRRVERAIFFGRFKYIQSTIGKRELYDLTADPGENQNLYDSGNPLDQSLANELNSWRRTVAHRSTPQHAPDRETLEELRSLGYIP